MVEVSRPGPGSRLLPLPKSNPPFTLGDLKRAIPPHCFKRSIPRSFAHLFRDIAIAFFFYYVATNYFHHLPHPLLYVAWPLYWLLQGCIFFAAWIVGHECGHHAFSDYQWLDDTVGFLVHSAVLTPYFSWKLSHRRHHSNTNSFEKDEAYVPNEKSENGSFSAKYLNNPPGRLFRVVIRLSLGWYLYVCFHVSGRKYDRFACHFDPYSPIYLESERALIMMSDAGLVAMSFALYHLATVKGFEWLLCVYGVPILVMYVVLVLVTYLHHTHIAIPHYNSSKWDWMRGSLATVDRDYGFLNVVFHNLTDTHVVHHLFSTMPHYHAVEATKAIKPILGEYYSYDGTPIIQALWRESKECIYVEPDKGDHKGIYWYSN